MSGLPSGSAAGLLLAIAVVAALGNGRAVAQSKACLTPPYIDPDAAVTDASHHHPTFAIVLFKRRKGGGVHDVERILLPPAGLGIDRPAIARTSGNRDTRYRRLHAHEGNGRLHVEQAPGAALRLCHLISLWRLHPAWPGSLAQMDRWPSAHIRVGDDYKRNTPMAQVLNSPLDHDRPVVLFLEAPNAL